MRYLLLSLTLVFGAFSYAKSLDHYQIIGSHNSYKKALPPEARQFLKDVSPELLKKISYIHPSLQEQLNLGIRQIEIDVVNDPNGHQYNTPEIETLANSNWFSKSERQILAEPGFKVLHIPHVDVMTHCLTLQLCAKQLLRWSEANPNHFPITVLVNAKESQPTFLSKAAPVAFSVSDYQHLDNEIAHLFGSKLVTPDRVRGRHHTLRAAITETGWPSVEALRGKFLFLFDANKAQKEIYLQQNSTLQNKSMFLSVPEHSDAAAIFIRNDPVKSQQEIQALVKDGFLVRTRADADLSATTQSLRAQRDAAFASGAQFISSDFYNQSPQSIRRGYSVSFENDCLKRFNAVKHQNLIN
ncbi:MULTISPECIES: Ca2+-dependent phosphoinositide-specific phospholipase C [unclassified Alteromonas]|uniref:Ca2+-dependent phosphoinositide-specific phospholipase C n=1 Tax=unclassified Alteromonas TaxID=2614992 RepID=UPI0005095C6D|nr:MULTISPECIES: Ca2+-dependent phosphoinositide-specific phospholipase C [unclassified Alteromonas]